MSSADLCCHLSQLTIELIESDEATFDVKNAFLAAKKTTTSEGLISCLAVKANWLGWEQNDVTELEYKKVVFNNKLVCVVTQFGKCRFVGISQPSEIA